MALTAGSEEQRVKVPFWYLFRIHLFPPESHKPKKLPSHTLKYSSPPADT